LILGENEEGPPRGGGPGYKMRIEPAYTAAFPMAMTII
jgi:hypothetical protein